MSEIEFTVQEKVATLSVNRPQVRNALDWSAMGAFAEAIESAHNHPDLRAMILAGARGSFISGADLSEMQEYPSQEDGRRLATIMGDALQRLEALAFPTIAAIDGPARGGGVEVSLACDLRIIAADADLAFVHMGLGLIPGWGGATRLAQLVGYPKAFELLLTARLLSADQAQKIGLVNIVVVKGEALSSAQKLARFIAKQSPEAVKAAKRVLRLGLPLADRDTLLGERAEFPPLWASEFRQEAVKGFLEKGR